MAKKVKEQRASVALCSFIFALSSLHYFRYKPHIVASVGEVVDGYKVEDHLVGCAMQGHIGRGCTPQGRHLTRSNGLLGRDNRSRASGFYLYNMYHAIFLGYDVNLILPVTPITVVQYKAVASKPSNSHIFAFVACDGLVRVGHRLTGSELLQEE